MISTQVFCFALICIKIKSKQGVISPYYEKYKKENY